MRRTSTPPPEPPIPFVSRIERPGGTARGVARGGWLTAYDAQDLADEALRAGAGARLELAVPDAAVPLVDERFAWLRRHGISVEMRRTAPAPV